MDYYYDGLINSEEGDKVEIIKEFPETNPVRVTYMKNLTKKTEYTNPIEGMVTVKSSRFLKNPIVGEVISVMQDQYNTYFNIK